MVDESFYLSQEQVAKIVAHCERKVSEGCGFKTNFQTKPGISGAIKTKEGSREYGTYIVEPQVIADPRRTFDKIQLSEQSIGISPTICSTDSSGPHLVILLGYTRDRYGRVTSYHPKLVSNTITTATGSGGNTDQFILTLDAEEATSDRRGRLRSKVLPNGNIRCFQDDAAKSGISELQIINPENVCPTVTTAHVPKVLQPIEIPDTAMQWARIRKLTPREAFRLMDVDDADIDKILDAKVEVRGKEKRAISKSACYRLAGNSICVGVMFHIFRTLFIDNQPENEYKPKQLELF